MNIADLISQTFSNGAKCYEPMELMCAGKFGYVRHRFPIKNGITIRDVMYRQITASNSLLARLRAKHGD